MNCNFKYCVNYVSKKNCVNYFLYVANPHPYMARAAGRTISGYIYDLEESVTNVIKDL